MATFPSKGFEITLPENGGSAIALIGASRSGKTTMMKYLYQRHFNKHIAVMCSMNPQAEIYKDMSSKVLVSEKFCPEILADIHKINSKMGNKFPFCFISDDYVDKKIKNSEEVTRALTIYRNANVSSMWSFQGRTLMSAVGRMNVNYVLIFKQQTPLEWTNVIKEYLDMWLPMGLTMQEKIAFCKAACEDHQLFVIDNIKGECYLSKLSASQIKE